MTDRSPPSLTDLQRFQAAFDDRAGLSFPAPSGDLSAQLHRVEFTCLALAGEVGEIANLLKKQRRLLWTSGEAPADLPALSDEIADVLAYTLKLCNLLTIDLSDAYSRKMEDNQRRFPPFPRVLSLMGPPGGGKTTVAGQLEDQLQVYVEHPELNENLQLFEWKDQDQALASQMWFLTSIDEYLADAEPERPLLLDQDPQAVVDVYSRLFRQGDWLNDDAVRELEQALEGVESRLRAWPRRRESFLLDAPAEVLDARVLERDGTSMGVAWIDRVRSQFHRLAEGMPAVETIRTDQCEPEDVAARVKERLDAAH